MTHHPIRVLEDGTRVYSNGTRYKPKAPEEWVKGQPRKPAVEGAVWWAGSWVLPRSFLPGDQRLWPETRADEDAYLHAAKPRRCKCRVCKRPQARKWRAKWRRDQKAQILTAS